MDWSDTIANSISCNAVISIMNIRALETNKKIVQPLFTRLKESDKFNRKLVYILVDRSVLFKLSRTTIHPPHEYVWSSLYDTIYWGCGKGTATQQLGHSIKNTFVMDSKDLLRFLTVYERNPRAIYEC